MPWSHLQHTRVIVSVFLKLFSPEPMFLSVCKVVLLGFPLSALLDSTVLCYLVGCFVLIRHRSFFFFPIDYHLIRHLSISQIYFSLLMSFFLSKCFRKAEWKQTLPFRVRKYLYFVLNSMARFRILGTKLGPTPPNCTQTQKSTLSRHCDYIVRDPLCLKKPDASLSHIPLWVIYFPL